MEIAPSILRTIKTSYRLKAIRPKDPLSEFKKEAFVLFESLLLKIKNDLIKFLLNLNIVVSNDEKSENSQEEIKESKSEKKLAEMKSAHVVRGKNSNIVTEIFKFFKCI